MIDKKFVVQWKVLDDFWYLNHINLKEDTWVNLDYATIFSESKAKALVDYYNDKDNSTGPIKMIEIVNSILKMKMTNNSLNNEKIGYQVYYLYEAGNWELPYWEASSKIFLDIDKAKEYANTFKCKTKIDSVSIVE